MIGIKRIEIPLSAEEVNEATILKYFTSCLSQFKANVSEMDRLHRIVLSDQDISKKVRYTTETKSNIKLVENHSWNIVDFKSSYNYGEAVQYSLADETKDTDDVSELNKYMREIHKDALDMDNAEDMYTTGLTTRLVMPNKDKNINSPFNIFNLSYNMGFVVYSSGYKHEKLFGVVVSKVDTSIYSLEEPYIFTIYAKDYIYELVYTSEGQKITKNVNTTGMVNMVECKSNKYAVSPVAIVETIQNAINEVLSSSADNINDFVNSILVIINNDFDSETLKSVRDNLALSLKGTPNAPADAKFLVNSLNYTDVNVFYEGLCKSLYDIVGVPRTSTTVTSGGDTGQARLLGGGWSKAEQVAKKEEKFLKQSESELLDIILSICKRNPETDMQLDCSDVVIGFNRTSHDNILSKCQSIVDLYQINFPLEAILNVVGVTTNVHELAKEWQSNIEEKERKEQEQLQKTFTNVNFDKED